VREKKLARSIFNMSNHEQRSAMVAL